MGSGPVLGTLNYMSLEQLAAEVRQLPLGYLQRRGHPLRNAIGPPVFALAS